MDNDEFTTYAGGRLRYSLEARGHLRSTRLERHLMRRQMREGKPKRPELTLIEGGKDEKSSKPD